PARGRRQPRRGAADNGGDHAGARLPAASGELAQRRGTAVRLRPHRAAYPDRRVVLLQRPELHAAAVHHPDRAGHARRQRGAHSGRRVLDAQAHQDRGVRCLLPCSSWAGCVRSRWRSPCWGWPPCPPAPDRAESRSRWLPSSSVMPTSRGNPAVTAIRSPRCPGGCGAWRSGSPPPASEAASTAGWTSAENRVGVRPGLPWAENPGGGPPDRVLAVKGLGLLVLAALGALYGLHSPGLLILCVILGGAAGFFLPDVLLDYSAQQPRGVVAIL